MLSTTLCKALLCISFGVIGLPTIASALDLRSIEGFGFKIVGESEFDAAGGSISGCGDINGDGLSDVVVGASAANRSDNGHPAGASYVVFGRVDGMEIDLASLEPDQGFRIMGEESQDLSGSSVAGVGDFNGDGFKDLAIGAAMAEGGGAQGRGVGYLVFGREGAWPTELDLRELDGIGIRISGAREGDASGISVSGAGDINGDGFSDLIIGAVGVDRDENVFSNGASYIVFGSADPESIDLGALQRGSGVRILGAQEFDASGRSVSGAGDINGDGFADVVLGASTASRDARFQSGASFVVLGSATLASEVEIDLNTLAEYQGFEITGAAARDTSGFSVSGAGDFNGDGLADLLVGAAGVDRKINEPDAGAAYVIYGSANIGPIDLSRREDNRGFTRIIGANAGDSAGVVAGAGDVNGDGFADIIIGAPGAGRRGGGLDAGVSYVVFGGEMSPSPEIDLRALPPEQGFQVVGEYGGDEAGRSVSGAGDVNGDGLSDLVVGAPGVLREDGISGAGYVVFSQEAPPLRASYASAVRSARCTPGSTMAQSALGVTGDGSNDDSPDSRVWLLLCNDLFQHVVTRPQIFLERQAPLLDSGEPAEFAGGNVVPGAISWTLQWGLPAGFEEVTSAATISLRYTDAEVEGLNEEALQLYGQPVGQEPQPFQLIPSHVDSARNIISAEVPTAQPLRLSIVSAVSAVSIPEMIFVDGFEP